MSTRTSRSKSVADINDLEPWDCQICKKVFKDSDAKMIECQRCSDHFCIKCLNKTKPEYEILSKSDSMWFCTKCRPIVEEHIVTDLKIEQRCREIMENYEQRLSNVESLMTEKCSEHRAREIVRDEIKKSSCDEEKVRMIAKEESLNLTKSNPDEPTSNQKDETPQTETVTNVIDEIQERKNRANNLIIFGLKENESDNIQERKEYDTEEVKKLFKAAKIELDPANIKSTRRLGRFDKNKAQRPLQVQLLTLESKLNLFRNTKFFKKEPEFTDVSVSNDLTKTERENEKKLWEEAKNMTTKDTSGNYQYKVRGPPWSRKIAKLKI